MSLVVLLENEAVFRTRTVPAETAMAVVGAARHRADWCVVVHRIGSRVKQSLGIGRRARQRPIPVALESQRRRPDMEVRRDRAGRQSRLLHDTK